MLGLDAAGKTSECMQSFCRFIRVERNNVAILYKLKLNQSVTTIPTGLYLGLYFILLADMAG